jgi:predicted NUDIX family NTP pyrophosphohydrolase
MAKQSAGILMYRTRKDIQEFLLVHPGGPFFAKKDEGHWTVPKGEILEDENPLDAALREFFEETGHQVSGTPVPLTPIFQKGGKKVWCWATEDELDASAIISNTFELQWPPKSGKIQTFPEVDKAAWFDLEQAKSKINERQLPFLEEVQRLKKASSNNH